MLLKSLHLKNFRCFTDETIELSQYTAFVGANNAGKSAIIAALDIFFRSNPKNIPLTFDDFFRREQRPLEIRLTFSELNKDAEHEFEHYARSGELSFYIKASIEVGQIVSSLHGIRLANPELAKFFEIGSAAEKKEFYNSQKATLELP
jgi:putative ATP-dependent endonuclease of the OLD family